MAGPNTLCESTSANRVEIIFLGGPFFNLYWTTEEDGVAVSDQGTVNIGFA